MPSWGTEYDFFGLAVYNCPTFSDTLLQFNCFGINISDYRAGQDHPTDFRPTRRHIDMDKYPAISACSAMYDRHQVPVEALPRPLPLVRPVARETGMGAAARRLLSRGGMEAPTGTHFVPLSQRVPLA